MDNSTYTSYRYAFLATEPAVEADTVTADTAAAPASMRRLAHRPTTLSYFLEAGKRPDTEEDEARKNALRQHASDLAKRWMEVRHRPGREQDAVRADLMKEITPMLRGLAIKNRRATGTQAAVEDLMQAARVAVLKAMPDYDAGISLFVSFASKIADSAMKREAMDLHCQVRVGTNYYDKKAYFFGNRTLREIELTKGPLGSDELYELAAAELNIPVDNLRRVMTALGNRSFSFDEDRTEGHEFAFWPHDHKELFDRRPLPEEAVAEETDMARLIPALSKAMGELTERDRGIIQMRLLDPEGDDASLAEIGRVFGYSKKHIREIVMKSLARLRTSLEAMGVTAEDIRDFVSLPRGRRPVINLALLDHEHLAR